MEGEADATAPHLFGPLWTTNPGSALGPGRFGSVAPPILAPRRWDEHGGVRRRDTRGGGLRGNPVEGAHLGRGARGAEFDRATGSAVNLAHPSWRGGRAPHARRRGLRGDRGSATVELAASLPALMLLLFAGLTAISAVRTQLQCYDAAR